MQFERNKDIGNFFLNRKEFYQMAILTINFLLLILKIWFDAGYASSLNLEAVQDSSFLYFPKKEAIAALNHINEWNGVILTTCHCQHIGVKSKDDLELYCNFCMPSLGIHLFVLTSMYESSHIVSICI